jgi:hypothetical protein
MRVQHEARIQREIVHFVRAVAPQCLIVAIPNGSQRTASGRPANAVAGLTAGVPDLAVIAPQGRIYWLEVKAEKGRVSDAQLAFHIELQGRNHDVAVVRSIEDVSNAFQIWGITMRGVIQ